jgi:hypothetical protein
VGASGRTRPIKASAFRLTTRETLFKKSALKVDIGTHSYNLTASMSSNPARFIKAHLEGIFILLLAHFAFRFFLNSVLDTISIHKDAEE